MLPTDQHRTARNVRDQIGNMGEVAEPRKTQMTVDRIFRIEPFKVVLPRDCREQPGDVKRNCGRFLCQGAYAAQSTQAPVESAAQRTTATAPTNIHREPCHRVS